VLAQVIDPSVMPIVEGLVGQWTAYAAFLSPILLGLITSENTRSKIKQGLPLVVAAVLAVIRALTEEGMTIPLLLAQVPALWLVCESGYRGMSLMASAVSNKDLSINDVLMKTKGLVK
jgi:hypothetical protein